MPIYPPRNENRATSRLSYPTQDNPRELVYTTVDGDDMDAIGFAHYGTSGGASEAIYARNPWLARYDAILPAGLKIVLPVIVTPAASRLWNY